MSRHSSRLAGRFHRVIVCLSVALLGLALVGDRARARPPIAGVWEGTYQCDQGTTGLALSIAQTGPERLVARFRFFPLRENPRVPEGEFEMSGSFHTSGRGDVLINLHPAGWIRQPQGFRKLPLTGQMDASGRTLTGRIRSRGCGTFTVQRTAKEIPQELIARAEGKGRGAPGESAPGSGRRATDTAREALPELQTQPVRVPNPGRMGPMMIQQPHEFGYMDGVIAKRVEAELGVEPIEELNQWLFKSGLKCLSSRSMSVGPSDFAANGFAFSHFGNKVYVVHCSGNCERLRYQVTTRHTLWHFGLSRPYPVLRVSSTDLSTGEIKFAFSHPQGGVHVTVSQWAGDPGDYGGGCANTMFEQKK